MKKTTSIRDIKIKGRKRAIMDLGVESPLVSLIPITNNTANQAADMLYPNIGNIEKTPTPEA